MTVIYWRHKVFVPCTQNRSVIRRSFKFNFFLFRAIIQALVGYLVDSADCCLCQLVYKEVYSMLFRIISWWSANGWREQTKRIEQQNVNWMLAHERYLFVSPGSGTWTRRLYFYNIVTLLRNIIGDIYFFLVRFFSDFCFFIACLRINVVKNLTFGRLASGVSTHVRHLPERWCNVIPENWAKKTHTPSIYRLFCFQLSFFVSFAECTVHFKWNVNSDIQV